MNITQANLTISVSAPGTNPYGIPVSNVLDNLNQSYTLTLTNGTAVKQVNQSWQAQRTLAASASETLALTGSLVDGFGETVNLARVKGLYIVNTSATGSMTIGNPWVGPWGAGTQTETINPGAFYFIGATDAIAYPVTSGSKNLLVTNNDTGNPLTYNIIILGCTA
jgi:hypothetical protein